MLLLSLLLLFLSLLLLLLLLLFFYIFVVIFIFIIFIVISVIFVLLLLLLLFLLLLFLLLLLLFFLLFSRVSYHRHAVRQCPQSPFFPGIRSDGHPPDSGTFPYGGDRPELCLHQGVDGVELEEWNHQDTQRSKWGELERVWSGGWSGVSWRVVV